MEPRSSFNIISTIYSALFSVNYCPCGFEINLSYNRKFYTLSISKDNEASK